MTLGTTEHRRRISESLSLASIKSRLWFCNELPLFSFSKKASNPAEKTSTHRTHRDNQSKKKVTKEQTVANKSPSPWKQLISSLDSSDCEKPKSHWDQRLAQLVANTPGLLSDDTELGTLSSSSSFSSSTSGSSSPLLSPTFKFPSSSSPSSTSPACLSSTNPHQPPAASFHRRTKSFFSKTSKTSCGNIEEEDDSQVKSKTSSMKTFTSYWNPKRRGGGGGGGGGGGRGGGRRREETMPLQTEKKKLAELEKVSDLVCRSVEPNVIPVLPKMVRMPDRGPRCWIPTTNGPTAATEHCCHAHTKSTSYLDEFAEKVLTPSSMKSVKTRGHSRRRTTGIDGWNQFSSVAISKTEEKREEGERRTEEKKKRNRACEEADKMIDLGYMFPKKFTAPPPPLRPARNALRSRTTSLSLPARQPTIRILSSNEFPVFSPLPTPFSLDAGDLETTTQANGDGTSIRCRPESRPISRCSQIICDHSNEPNPFSTPTFGSIEHWPTPVMFD